jgi:nucleolar GTP-binding protein
MDYNYLRWQVIDSPGVLDRPLEDRNTIEMTAITALAHLNACVIFIIDISPIAKYSIAEQCKLFRSLKPLYTKKPVVVVCNKTDLRKTSELSQEEADDIKSLAKDSNVSIMEMSNVSEENIVEVRNKACDILLGHRLHIKTQTNKLSKASSRIRVTMPVKRDNKERPVFIPPLRNPKGPDAMDTDTRKTEKTLEDENGGHGVYNVDMRKFWKLKNSAWKYDAVPEVWNGKNIADFVDSDILKKLDELEREEDQILAAVEEAAASRMDDNDDLSEGEELIYDEIQYQKAKKQSKHSTVVARNQAVRPRKIRERTLGGMQEHLEDLGYDMSKLMGRAEKVAEEQRGRSKVRRERAAEREDSAMAVEKPRRRSKSRVTEPAPGMPSIQATMKSRSLLHRSLVKIGKRGRQGTSDRFIGNFRPKHLNSGKRGIGKTDRR